jgi:hypothetical protein
MPLPKLSDLGITCDQASKWQKLADPRRIRACCHSAATFPCYSLIRLQVESRRLTSYRRSPAGRVGIINPQSLSPPREF